MAVFVPGQCWIYSNMGKAANSRFVVRAVEYLPTFGTVVHLSVLDLEPEEETSGVVVRISHLPFAEAALRHNALEMEAYLLIDDPGVEESYAIWQSAFMAGEAGVWNQPLTQVLHLLEYAEMDAAGVLLS